MLLSSRTSFACGFVPALLSLTACGGSSDTHSSGTTTGATTTTGLGTGGAGTTTTTATGTTTTTHTGTGGGAAVPPGPQVVTAGGPVLKAPKVQLIAYASDPFVTDVEAFITELGATTEWASQTAEYGVGAFTKLPTILIPGTPPSLLDDNSGQVAPLPAVPPPPVPAAPVPKVPAPELKSLLSEALHPAAAAR